ncbi:TonB-dependent receptor [candidate division KSB1 bacterium]|nr:TonB-dependent receptor [candidate division KSB1 bacterium]
MMRWLKSLFVVLMIPVFLYAGTTGKVTGRVTDSVTGEALPGVNVIIQGTSWGAASNLDGHYTILNVSPGTYSMQFSMMGYADYVVRNVRVVIDLTTTTNARLKPETLTGEEVVVVAQRPVVTKDVSNSQMNIEAATIESMPVQTVEQVLSLQAGIESGSEGIIVRGGGAHQTAFMLDGLSMNDERSNIPYAAVSLSSVKEIQVQTGGFSAEYGNLRSGLVNVVTKEGEGDRYTLSATLRYSPAAQKNFGSSIYDRYSYFNRPYMDPDVCYTGTNNGAWDNYLRNQYPNFEGWNSVADALMRDNDPGNDLTPGGAKRLYEWQHRRQGDIDKPDYFIDAGFGGPVPFVNKALGDLRFYLTHFREQDMFIYPLSRDHYGENHTQLKLNSNITSSLKLTLTGLYGEVHSVSPYQWTTTPTGRVLQSQSEIANLLSSTAGASILYMPGYFSPSSIYRTMFGLKLSHVLTPSTYYEINLQHNTNNYNTFKTADRDTSSKYEPVPGYFVDEAPYGYFGYSVSGVDGMGMGGWMNLGRDKSVNSTTTFRFDITSQVNTRNQVKAGVHVVYNDFDIKSYTDSPSMGTWTREMFYNVFPYRIGVYIQDKLEYEGFIANLGVRMDYSDPNSDWFALSDYDKNLSAGYGNSLEASVESKETEARLNFSPRLGISHPITENSKLYFNYGHFRQEPFSSYRFRIQRESNGLVTYLGDPGMELEKTVAYELGFAQSVFNMFLINIAAYYKDITNQPGWIYYENINGSVQYRNATNNNYADIRGFELTLTKRMGKWITGFVNYTYDVQTSGYFGLRYYYQDPNKQRDYLRLNPYQSKPHPQPYARANIDIHSPRDFGPYWLGIYPLGSINLNILANWRSGSYATYNPNSIPGVVDNVRWKDYYNLDLRFAKNFEIKGFDLQFYVDVRNALNTKRLSYAGFSDNYDYLDYLESLNFNWETDEEKGDDRIGDYRPDDVEYDPLEPNPNNDPEIKARNEKRKEDKSYIDMPNIKAFSFLYPRDIMVGLKINF